MALPISTGEIFAVAKFAYDLWQSCKAFEGEFEQLGKEVFAMRTIVELVHIDCQDPESIINLVDNKEKTRRKELGVYIRNCEQALKSVDRLLKRYEAMNLWDRLRWSLSGHAEISSLESNLSSFATQLDSYVQKLELRGIALVNRNVGLVNKNVVSRIGRLEDLLEHFNGDGKAAVTEILQERQKCGASQKDRARSTKVMLDYVKEICQENNKKQRPRTPDPPRGRPQHNRTNLEVPKGEKRGLSADSSSNPAGKTIFSPKSNKARKPSYTLECWLIQRKSAQALFVTFELSEKESQCRGQWKLREMAEQFNGLCETDKLGNKHELVDWVLRDRNKKEEDADFKWYPHAAKIERKADLLLGIGIEEQAMVIIKRQMTPSAQKVADEKAAARAEKAVKEAKAQKKAEELKAAEATLKKEKKEQATKIKALEKANTKRKMPQAESKVPRQDKSEKVTDGVGAPGDSAIPSTKDKSGQSNVVENSKISTPSANDKSTKVKNQDADGKSIIRKASRKHPNVKKAKPEPTVEIEVSGQESGASAAISETITMNKYATKKDKKKDKKEEGKPDREGKAVADTSATQAKQGRKAAEIQALKDENARLKAALQEAGSQV